MHYKHSGLASTSAFSDKFAGYCCVKDISLTLTDCSVFNSFTLLTIKKLFTQENLMILIKMVYTFTKQPVSILEQATSALKGGNDTK